MISADYLPRLNVRLADGLAHLPAPFRSRHAAFLHGLQQADGGFPGREGGSDLYYTGFALRGLSALDALTPDVVARVAGYLGNALARQASIVDFFSLLYSCLLVQTAGGPDVLAAAPSDWPDRVAAVLETFATADGGYGKSVGAASGSTYHTFLVGLTYELLGRRLPRPAEAARFVAGRHRDDGGYVEIAPMKRSGTNPTAAAVGVLQLVGEPIPAEVADFLSELTSIEGGLKANARAPLADLLSTFTGSWTLEQLGARGRVDGAELLEFAEGLEAADGGYRGGLWDDRADVEYTFYGLGVVALFA